MDITPCQNQFTHIIISSKLEQHMEQSPAPWVTCKQCPRFKHVDGNAMKVQLTNLFTFASSSSTCRICNICSIVRTFSSISSFVKIGASFFLKISRSFWCIKSLLPGKKSSNTSTNERATYNCRWHNWSYKN